MKKFRNKEQTDSFFTSKIKKQKGGSFFLNKDSKRKEVSDNNNTYNKKLVLPETYSEEEKRAIVAQQMAQDIESKRGTLKEITKEKFKKTASVGEIARNPVTALKRVLHGQSIPENFSKGDEKNPYDLATSIVNPLTYVDAVKNTARNLVHPAKTFNTLGKATYNLATNLVDGRNIYDDGSNEEALGMVGDAALALGVKSGVKDAFRIADKQFSKVGQGLERIRYEGEAAGLDAHTIAKNQMEQIGITSNQRQAYKPLISNFAEKYIHPYGYQGMQNESKIAQTWKNIKQGGLESKESAAENMGVGIVGDERGDAWSLYLGKPQKHGTFSLANTAPVNHPSYTGKQLKGMDVYNIESEYGKYGIEPKDLDINPYNLEKTMKLLDRKVNIAHSNNIMGGYNRLLSKEGTQYNDIWDLQPHITPSRYIPQKYQNALDENPLFYKKTENGFLPRSFNISVDKFLGKPFMSHGSLPYSSQNLVDEMTNSLNSSVQHMKLNNNPEVLAPKINKYEKLVEELKGYPKFKEGGEMKKQFGGPKGMDPVKMWAYSLMFNNSQPQPGASPNDIKFSPTDMAPIDPEYDLEQKDSQNRAKYQANPNIQIGHMVTKENPMSLYNPGKKYTGSDFYKQPKESNFDPYFTLRGLTTGASWLAGMADRGRQNQYLANQNSTLGQLNPTNIQDAQPTNYNPYAQYGGATPIVVNNPNDPRLRAYQDSLRNNNNFIQADKLLSSQPNVSRKEDGNKVYYNAPTGNGKDFLPQSLLLNNGVDYRGIEHEESYYGYSNRPNTGTWSAPISKKPVQPVVYQQNNQPPLKTGRGYDGHWRDENGTYWSKDPQAKDYKAQPVSKPIPKQEPQLQKPSVTNVPLPQAKGMQGAGIRPIPVPDMTQRPTNFTIDNHGTPQYFQSYDQWKSFADKNNLSFKQEAGDKSSAQANYFQNGGSIVNYLASKGIDFSKSSRAKLAKQFGIENYDFSAEKNTELLHYMSKNFAGPSQEVPISTSKRSTQSKVPQKSTPQGHTIPTSYDTPYMIAYSEPKSKTPESPFSYSSMGKVNVPQTSDGTPYFIKAPDKKEAQLPFKYDPSKVGSSKKTTKSTPKNTIPTSYDTPYFIKAPEKREVKLPFTYDPSKVKTPAKNTSQTTDRGIPAEILPYADRMADGNNGRIILTDKGTKRTYYGTRDKNGKFNVQSFEVITGKNDDPRAGLGNYDNEKVGDLLKEEQQGNFTKMTSPLGAFSLRAEPMYGGPALREGNTSYMYHQTYPGEFAQRNPKYNDGDLSNNNMSFGCINCQRPNIDALTNFYQKGDSSYTVDSRLPQDINMQMLNRKFGEGGTANDLIMSRILKKGGKKPYRGKFKESWKK